MYKQRLCKDGFIKRKPLLDELTFVDDCLPLVKLALVWQTVEVSTLNVSKGRSVQLTWCGVTDPVLPPFSQTIFSSVFWTAGNVKMC